MFFRFLHDPGTIMSFLPSSQENTLYSPRVTLCYSTSWRMVLTSAQSARFVVSPCSPLEMLFYSVFICTANSFKGVDKRMHFYLARIISVQNKLSKFYFFVFEFHSY